MRRSALFLLVVSIFGALAGSVMSVVPVGAMPSGPPAPGGPDRLEVYTGEVSNAQLADIVDLGVDRHEIGVAPLAGEKGPKAQVRVETILSGEQARRLADQGLALTPKRIEGQTALQRSTEALEEGFEVFRKYSGADGIKAEFEQVAARNRQITKLVTIGKTVQGQDIVAMKVTRNARRTRDGARPAVLYLSAQHAREWITPEMTRRLMRYVVDGYYEDRSIRRLLGQTELWFVPVANPDGYDFTFQPGRRLWRKNLRDNNGDGLIEPGDGVDLNRNWPTRWGYDNEGSSPSPASETYRGPGPASEPETKALGAFADRIDFEFLVNYHSAAELLLYGTGWQVATPTPDDVIYEALVGDDERPAVPGYDPDISAELYTTNGDTDTDLTERFGILGFTPEMSTCEVASRVDPDDEWVETDCGSGFEFPDDEDLVQSEFEKNIPFALSVAESADDPADPDSSLGLRTPNFRLDSFDVSYGDPQTVAVTAKRALRGLEMNYRINGGRVRTVPAPEWAGGERYGDENDDYYAEYRGRVRFADAGDRVQAWFSARERGRGDVSSSRFTYTVKSDTGSDVLVIADEDYTGVNPTYPAGTSAPKYADAHVAAVEAAGYSADVWDVDAQGVPHDLGVLSHYDAVLWYLGDNRLTQDPEDELTTTPIGDLRDVSVAERAQQLTLAVRDYLNSGGKLIHAGETAQYQGLPGVSTAVGGLYYGLNGDPSAECVVTPRPTSPTAGLFEDCLILADDFRQYYLGAFNRLDTADPSAIEGLGGPLAGFAAGLGGPVVEGANPLNEAGALTPTSDVLPAEEFPQFASSGSATYPLADGSPYAPIEGGRYAGILHQDSTYSRLTRTVNVPAGASAAQLRFQLSYDAEPGYDHVIVEARPAGGTAWTTLPEAGGATSTTPPAECSDPGFLLDLHPFLRSYLGGADCTAPGTTGTWNAFTGSSEGWQPVAFDLSAYSGQDVEVSISYVSDPGSGGVGVFVDDTHVVIDGADDADGFEGPSSDWTPGPAPEGSPPATPWEIDEALLTLYAATSTEDSLLLGFGLEQMASADERSALVGRALDGLLE